MSMRSNLSRYYPFNAQQTINLVGEIGPIFTMFIVNAVWGITAGVWALILTTLLSLVVTLSMFKRPPIMPFIAGGVSISFGALALITGDDMWVQIKVTIFNSLVALLLWAGLKTGRNFFEFVFGNTFRYTPEGWTSLTRNFAIFFLVTAIANEAVRLGFRGVEIHAFHHVFKSIDIWVLFKLLIVMPMTGLFSVWQVRALQKYRLPEPQVAAARTN
jgi:intracellular septation protein